MNSIKRERYQETFRKFVPEAFVSILTELLLSSNVQFKIVNNRKTKLGDFRVNGMDNKPIITVNGDLNPYSFLITTLHEFAHFKTYQKFGGRVQAHGMEWKHSYREMLDLVLDSPAMPQELKKTLLKSYFNVKASSCADVSLSRVLQKYDIEDEHFCALEMLPKSCKFALNNKIFIKGEKRRTRFECKELSTGKTYLVHVLAKVKILNNE